MIWIFALNQTPFVDKINAIDLVKIEIHHLMLQVDAIVYNTD